MTPEQHAKAIEDAAFSYADAHLVLNRNPHKETLDKANAALCGLKDAIIAAVGAAPPKDSAEFALAALVAAGHVSQSKVDYARALMPEGGDVTQAAPEGWMPIETAPKDGTYILLGSADGSWIARNYPVYQSGYRPDNPWQSMMLNHEHMGRYPKAKPTHWMPLPAAPKP